MSGKKGDLVSPGTLKPHILPPFSTSVSGLYQLDPVKSAQLPAIITSIELRLDIDGWYPQNVVSMAIDKKQGKKCYLYALVSLQKKRTYTFITKRQWGGRSPLSSQLTIRIVGTPGAHNKVSICLSGTLKKDKKPFRLHFHRISKAFRSVNMEYDRVEGIESVLSVKPLSHPVHAPSLPQKIQITDVFNRSGIHLAVSKEHSDIPLSFAGEDHAWNHRELHDAMQAYWTHYSTLPTWSMWILFANQFAKSNAIAGMMFDTKKDVQRRGLALFNDSFVFEPPPDDGAKKAWKQRGKFFTVCHEMGHLFNLAHSWEKKQGRTWMRVKNRPHSRSFMNNPHLIDEGYTSFFRAFDYRFDDGELQFLRHAPQEYVQMGNSVWFKNHAMSLHNNADETTFTFELRSGRSKNRYSFMEPVVVECKLKNSTRYPQVVDVTEEMFAEKCIFYIGNNRWRGVKKVEPFSYGEYGNTHATLLPGKSWYASQFVSVGVSGWLIDQPGSYTVQACLIINGRMVVSNSLVLEVTTPCAKHLETIAQDYFSDEVGRVLAFDGSRVLQKANDVLPRCIEEDMPHDIASHARIALSVPLQSSGKTVCFGNSMITKDNVKIIAAASDPRCVEVELGTLFLSDDSNGARVASTLGTIDFRKYADMYTDWLEEQGAYQKALKMQKKLYSTLRERGVRNPDILGSVEKRIKTINKGTLF